MKLALVRSRYLAAIAAGIAACRPETKPVDMTVSAVPSDTATAAATATATASASATAAATASATASATVTASVAIVVPPKMKCSAPAKLLHQCYAKNTVPSRGGGVGMPAAPYTGWDKNGCFPASELVGTCSGNQAALGPNVEKGQCCYDVCGGLAVPCGRPLLVDGSARIARTTRRDDWSAKLKLEVSGDAALAWQNDAALEHASIAAFAKLALELLALGAPPDLVAAANRAALEEIEHAKICFAIAGGVGPAALSLDGMALSTDLTSVAFEAAAQSCVGETIAGLALARASELCAPELAPLLAKMAEEELGHAAFGWKLVAWACASGGEPVRARVREALVVGDYTLPVVGDADAWHRDGRLTNEDMREVLDTACALVSDAARALQT
jgi:hypothetical protein